MEFDTINNLTSSHLTASIHTASGGFPGTSLGTLTNPVFPNSSSNQVLTFTSTGINLSANTTYFLVIDMSARHPGSALAVTTSHSEDTGNLASWGIGDGSPFRLWNSNVFGITHDSSLKISLGGIVINPTVSLSRVGSGAVSEGGTVEFTVTLDRALVAGETIDVPLSIGGTGVTTSDWSLAKKSGSTNTGVTLRDASTSTPTVRFDGAGAQTATLVLTPADDGPSEGTETYEIALGSGGDATPDSTANSFTVSGIGPPYFQRI